ncbi:MAG TPA: sulfite exporter TauE/SafE family protein [Clostridia bacterium]|nr:sulfite exporter TauE/SafE family protein [Clostridia bacterium]
MGEAILMLAGGAAAGVFGSLLGLGGGVLIVPLLTLGFGLDLRAAVGISLVSVIVTSSAAAGVYLERNVANLRLGMTLELFTAIGALVGGLIAFLIEERVLALLFAALLGYVAVTMARSSTERAPEDGARPLPSLEPDASEPAPGSPAALHAAAIDRLSGEGYAVRNLGRGVVGATGAGVFSALLGVGGGIVKVPLMHVAMGVPLRVSTATSNLMVGITAAASAVIYLLRDEIDPYVAGPVAIGVFLGASVGSRVAHRVDLRILRWLFVVVMLYTAVQMLLRGLG